MRYRDLDTGTFLTRDPIGYADGPNVYCYVHCNPIMSFDAFGLSGWLIIETSSSEDGSSRGISGHSWIRYHKDGGGKTTWGTFGNDNGEQKRRGLNKNTELKKRSTQGRAVWIDDDQEKKLVEILQSERKKEKKAWGYTKNCSSFAEKTWNEVTGESVDAANGEKLDTPMRLGENLKKQNGGKDHLQVPKPTLSSSASNSKVNPLTPLQHEQNVINGQAPAPATQAVTPAVAPVPVRDTVVEDKPVTEPDPVVDDDSDKSSL
jgi:uncharacterized protein RhaS with RHS repeats